MESNSLKQSLLEANESSTEISSTASAVDSKRFVDGDDRGSNLSTLSYANIEKQLRRRTIIVGYIIFLNAACKGILFPILWPLCYRLGGNRFDQGR